MSSQELSHEILDADAASSHGSGAGWSEARSQAGGDRAAAAHGRRGPQLPRRRPPPLTPWLPTLSAGPAEPCGLMGDKNRVRQRQGFRGLRNDSCDDTASIQAAIDASSSNLWGTGLYFPSGISQDASSPIHKVRQVSNVFASCKYQLRSPGPSQLDWSVNFRRA